MSRINFRRPSAALLIATMALVVAVAGGGEAIADAGVQIAKTINGKSIKKNSVPADRIKKNSLTGTQIDEGKLGKVPSANTADSAAVATNATNATNAAHATSADTATSAASVAGTVTKTFNFKGTASASQTIGEFAGFKVVASCTGAQAPVLTVTNNGSSTGEFITNRIDQSGTATTNTQFNYAPGVAESVMGAVAHGTANFSTARPDGAVLTGQVFYDNNPSYGATFTGCAVAGSLVYSG